MMFYYCAMKRLQKINPVLTLLAILTLCLFTYISRNYHITITIARKHGRSPPVRSDSTESSSGSHIPFKSSPMQLRLEYERHLHGNEGNDDDVKTEENNFNNRALNFTPMANLPIDMEQNVPSMDELYKRMAIVSAFSQNHYLEALSFIASAQKNMPDKKIIIYDLGISESTVTKVKKLCNVELRSFPWQSYPVHVKSLHNYAWKPIIIDITLREFGAIFWGDASVRFKSSLKKLIPASTKHHGFMSHWHSFDTQTNTPIRHQYHFTNPAMYGKLGVDRRLYYSSKDVAAYPAANRQLYINGSVIQLAIIQPMLRCSLELRCIAPEGSKVGNHRFDASLLAILIYKNLKGEWSPTNNDNAIFDQTIDIKRSIKGHEKARTCAR